MNTNFYKAQYVYQTYDMFCYFSVWKTIANTRLILHVIGSNLFDWNLGLVSPPPVGLAPILPENPASITTLQ